MENLPINKKKQVMIGLPSDLKETFDSKMKEEGYTKRTKYIRFLLTK